MAVSPDDEAAFLASMKGHPTTVLGTVDDTEHLLITDGDDSLVHMHVDAMTTAWKGTLDLTGGMA